MSADRAYLRALLAERAELDALIQLVRNRMARGAGGVIPPVLIDAIAGEKPANGSIAAAGMSPSIRAVHGVLRDHGPMTKDAIKACLPEMKDATIRGALFAGTTKLKVFSKTGNRPAKWELRGAVAERSAE